MKIDVQQEGEGNTSLINSSINLNVFNLNSDFLLEIQRHVASGQFEKASKALKILLNGISSQHPAYPYWRYDFDFSGGEVVFRHVPNSIEALTTHQLHGQIKFSVPEKYSNFKNINELLKYSYGKQIEVDINVISITTYAGDILVEHKESSEVNKIKARVKPMEFPPPIPMKLSLNDNSWVIDYLEMGLKEIDDNYIIIDNSKQNLSKYNVTLRINNNNKSGTINFKIRDQYISDVSANLVLNNLICLHSGRQLLFTNLENGKTFMSASDCSFGIVPKGLKKYIAILNDLIELENFYKVKFELDSEGLDEESLKKIALLKAAMDGEPFRGYYDNLSSEADSKIFLENILKYNKPNGNYMKIDLIKDSDRTINLLGVDILFRKREVHFKNIVLLNEEKLKRKLDVMDEGETVIVHLGPYSKDKEELLDYYFDPVIE